MENVGRRGTLGRRGRRGGSVRERESVCNPSASFSMARPSYILWPLNQMLKLLVEDWGAPHRIVSDPADVRERHEHRIK
jgi:hypothetical protein